MPLPKARPLYSAPLAELSTVITAFVASTLGFQAAIVPSSVAKMNAAAKVDPGSRNPLVVLAMIAVGADIEPVGELAGGGIVTTKEAIVPSPENRLELPE